MDPAIRLLRDLVAINSVNPTLVPGAPGECEIADAVAKRWSADAAIVTEPTDLAIAIGHKGFAWIEIEVLGKAAHGSRPAEGQDAILRLGRVLGRLEQLDAALQALPPHPLVGTGS